MALRRFASDASLRLGLRIQAGLVAEQPNYFGLLTSRAFATGTRALAKQYIVPKILIRSIVLRRRFLHSNC